MKAIKNILFITLPSVVVMFLVLEGFFRWVIPACEKPRGYLDETSLIYKYSEAKPIGLYTIGRFAEIRTPWRINNEGWNFPVDYYPGQDKKLIAVIGDSFVKALEVDPEKNFSYLLREKIGEEFEIYAFGKSGAPLSQYINMSRYINRKYKPEILIFSIVYNDFDESLKTLHPWKEHMMQFELDSAGNFKEIISVFPGRNMFEKIWGKMRMESALLRYIFWNAKGGKILSFFRKRVFSANIDVSKVFDNRELIYKATDHMVSIIKDENRDKRIIFVQDAPRQAIYDNTLEESDVLWMNAMMREMCEKYDVEYIDLTEPMQRDFLEKGERFNSKLDGHWNEYGHEFVADILYRKLTDKTR